MSLYSELKQQLKQLAKDNKGMTDKPRFNMMLNDEVDNITKNLPYSMSDKRKVQITNWLSSYVCTLHKK